MRTNSEGRVNFKGKNTDVWVISGSRHRLQSWLGILGSPRVGGVNKTSDLENTAGLHISAFSSARQLACRGSSIRCWLAREQY